LLNTTYKTLKNIAKAKFVSWYLLFIKVTTS